MPRKPLFVFICDSYFDHTNAAWLKPFGLQRDVNLDYAGAGGSGNIFLGDNPEERPVDAENLLVFTGSFHGDVPKAEAYAKEIKAANPGAKIYFRSSTEDSEDPVFEASISKDKEELYRIIREFVETTVGLPA